MKTRHMLAASLMALGAVFAPITHAHTRLEASDPKANAVVETAPKVVRLQFSDPVELPFSKVRLLDKGGVAGAPLKVEIDKTNPKALIATMPPLQSGAHRVQWTTVTRDGHKVKGELAFQVR